MKEGARGSPATGAVDAKSTAASNLRGQITMLFAMKPRWSKVIGPGVIVLFLGAVFAAAVAQTSLQARIEVTLDSWSGRSSTREAILKLSDNPVPALINVANSKLGSELRRVHAVDLLAAFKTQASERALKQVARQGTPVLRCSALRALVELDARHAIPVLVDRLDDHGACMRTISTDPAGEHDVYVSDEAVRLLEQITGQSFDQAPSNDHRTTKPWKQWWIEQTKSSKPTS